MDEKVIIDNIPQFLDKAKKDRLHITRRLVQAAGKVIHDDLVVIQVEASRILKIFDRTPEGEQELVDWINGKIFKEGYVPIWI